MAVATPGAQVNDETNPGELSILVSQPSEGLRFVRLTGEIDLLSSRDVLEALTKIGADHVVVDLSEITFIDSAGLHALVSGARTIEAAGGTAVFAAPNAHVQRVFEIVKLPDVIAVEETVELALARAELNSQLAD